jgi:hypothetical protein
MSRDAEGHWATLGIWQGVLSNIKKTPRGVIFVVERVTMRACWENIEETSRRHCGTLGSIEPTSKNLQFFEKMLLYCLLPYWNAILKTW